MARFADSDDDTSQTSFTPQQQSATGPPESFLLATARGEVVYISELARDLLGFNRSTNGAPLLLRDILGDQAGPVSRLVAERRSGTIRVLLGTNGDSRTLLLETWPVDGPHGGVMIGCWQANGENGRVAIHSDGNGHTENGRTNGHRTDDRGTTSGSRGLAIAPELASLLAASPLPTAVVAIDSTILATNAPLERLVAQTAPNLLGGRFATLIADAEWAELQNRFAALAAGSIESLTTTTRLAHIGEIDGQIDLSAARLAYYPGWLLVVVTDRSELAVLTDRLEDYDRRLRATTAALERKTQAIDEMLGHLELAKRQLADNMRVNLETLLAPVLTRLEKRLASEDAEVLRWVHSLAADLTSPFIGNLRHAHPDLSPRELTICEMIKKGLSSKEMASILNVSEDTIKKQRKSVRRRLNIANTKVSLLTALRQYDTGPVILDKPPRPV